MNTRIRGYTVSDYKCMKKCIRGYVDTQSVIISVCKKWIRGYVDTQSVILSVCKKWIRGYTVSDYRCM